MYASLSSRGRQLRFLPQWHFIVLTLWPVASTSRQTQLSGTACFWLDWTLSMAGTRIWRPAAGVPMRTAVRLSLPICTPTARCKARLRSSSDFLRDFLRREAIVTALQMDFNSATDLGHSG